MQWNRTPTAPLFGVLPRSALRWIGLGLVLAILACGMVVTVLWLQAGGPVSVTDRDGETADEERVNKEFGQHRFERLEKRQIMRYGLQKIDQKSVDIWQDIQVFEDEARDWRTKFEELLTSETGKRLGKDPWVVRYFWDQWKARLPKATAPDDYRDDLNTLIVSIREALKEETTAYRPSQDLLDAIGKVETNVREGRRIYTRHRRLLDALIGMMQEEKPVDQKTLKDRVDELDRQMALEESNYPQSSNPAASARTPTAASEETAKNVAERDEPTERPPSGVITSEDLLKQHNQGLERRRNREWSKDGDW